MGFAAGRGAVADRLVRGAALAELLLAGNRRHRGLPAGAPWQSKGTAVAERHREDVAYCATADAAPSGRLAGTLAQSQSAPAEQERWQKARVGAGRQILSDSPSDLAITSAAQVLPYVFTAVRGISQSC